MKRPRFKHFVIIKFDYPHTFPFLDIKSQQLRWTCLESLRHQTNMEFVMVFNSTVQMPHEGFGELIVSPVWKDKVRAAAQSYDYIITTRLDGDDFVMPNFIQDIQDNFVPEDRTVLQPNGWIYDARVDKAVDNWMAGNYVLNSLSFIEKTWKNDIQTCYGWPHSKMKRLFPVKFLSKQTHVWCINLESLKACAKPPEYFVKDLPDQKDAILKHHPARYKLLMERVMNFNLIIKKTKKEFKLGLDAQGIEWREIWKEIKTKKT